MIVSHWTEMYPFPGRMHNGHAIRSLILKLREIDRETNRHQVHHFDPVGSNLYKWFLPNYKIRAQAHQAGPDQDLYFQQMLALPGAIGAKLINPLWQKKILGKIGSQMNTDLIHVHYNVNLAYGAMLTAKKRGIPLVLTLRRELDGNVKRLGRERAKLLLNAIKESDAVISPSWHLAEKCRQLTGRQVIVIPSGTASCFDQPHSAYDDSRRNVLFVGSLDHNKGILPLIKASLELFKKGVNFELRVIGQGPLFSKLVALANGNPNIIFFGKKTPEEVRDQMRKAKLFCMPSYSETLGLVFIEAMKQGAAVIGRTGTGIDGVGKKGVHYEAIHQDSDLPDMLLFLLTDDKARKSIAYNGQKLVGKLTWENCAGQHIELYERLIRS